MASERESLPVSNVGSGDSRVLVPVEYNISGNVFRVYYDKSRRAVFVLDNTQNELKPNVLLVIPESDDRKWDEILTSDWNLDLETIRPRKDNKYQKLDIEYNDLDVYSNLVAASDNGQDLSAPLQQLNVFRTGVVRRIALERLGTAMQMAAHAQNTIAQTNDTISDLNTRLKNLRAKLNQQKKDIGREPTKQSASKILKSDAQIEAANEKLTRAKKRLANAQRRLVAAEDEANATRRLLDLIDGPEYIVSHAENKTVPANAVMVVPADAQEDKELITKPKAEEMAEEDVKPLFDKDPEILDEEIAFKPIDFGAPITPDATARQNDNPAPVVNASDAIAPLSFTPPQDSGIEVQAASDMDNKFGPVADVPTTPVLDSMRPVQDTPAYMPEPMPEISQPRDYVSNPADSRAEFAMTAAEAPVVQNPDEYINKDVQISMPPAGNAVRPNPAPMPAVAAAPVGSGFRPASPIRGNVSGQTSGGAQKSKLVYYVMLLMLIVLSIFTLWLYQRGNNQNIPEITTTAGSDDAKAVSDSPFINAKIEKDVVTAPVIAEPEPEEVAVVVPEPQPEPPIVSEAVVDDVALPVTNSSEAEFEKVPVDETDGLVDEEEPVKDVSSVSDAIPTENTDTAVPVAEDDDNPFLTSAVKESDDKPSLNNILPNNTIKPIYNVSQQEKMFVADSEYETDAPVVQDVASEEVVCSDGAYPDANGCCGGEIFTDMEDGTFACCQLIENGECFAPMR